MWIITTVGLSEVAVLRKRINWPQNAFLFIKKTHEKCIKTHGKSLQKCIDLKTEDELIVC